MSPKLELHFGDSARFNSVAIRLAIPSPTRDKAMKDTLSEPSLFDITDELLVASTLLAMMEATEGKNPELLEMCTFSVAQCQEMVEKMVRSDRRKY